ncbi:MAG: alpha/beta hydrolase, partial [Planctomycetota bacterium]
MEVFFPGPAGRLEGLHELPEAEPRFAAVVCHPHPLHGGTMANTIVYRVARALRAAGGATLRFNFRGVGASEGESQASSAEEGDVRAALDLLEREHPGAELWAGGF